MGNGFISKLIYVAVAMVIVIFAQVCPAADDAPTSCSLERYFQPRTGVCEDLPGDRELAVALQLICGHPRVASNWPDTQKVIIIGFLGGFVRDSDRHHPEVWFADYLRQHYSSQICVGIYSNHERKEAEKQITRILDTDSDGSLSESEKRNAKIIIFGHSWGASETAALAKDLGRRGIPVLLTIQLDIIPKPFQKPSIIPSNVEQAINVYQSEGFLRGKDQIIAEDPNKTRILGNIRMNYQENPIDCGNFPWFPRTFNKPHHEIENDQNVWELVRGVIDANLGRQDQVANNTQSFSRGLE